MKLRKQIAQYGSDYFLVEPCIGKNILGVFFATISGAYQIAKRDNSKFPEVLAFLNLIDNAWNSKMSADEGAPYIAALYYCGILKAGCQVEAQALLLRINSVSQFRLMNRMIFQERWNSLQQPFSPRSSILKLSYASCQ